MIKQLLEALKLVHSSEKIHPVIAFWNKHAQAVFDYAKGMNSDPGSFPRHKNDFDEALDDAFGYYLQDSLAGKEWDNLISVNKIDGIGGSETYEKGYIHFLYDVDYLDGSSDTLDFKVKVG